MSEGTFSHVVAHMFNMHLLCNTEQVYNTDCMNDVLIVQSIKATEKKTSIIKWSIIGPNKGIQNIVFVPKLLLVQK